MLHHVASPGVRAMCTARAAPVALRIMKFQFASEEGKGAVIEAVKVIGFMVDEPDSLP